MRTDISLTLERPINRLCLLLSSTLVQLFVGRIRFCKGYSMGQNILDGMWSRGSLIRLVRDWLLLFFCHNIRIIVMKSPSITCCYHHDHLGQFQKAQYAYWMGIGLARIHLTYSRRNLFEDIIVFFFFLHTSTKIRYENNVAGKLSLCPLELHPTAKAHNLPWCVEGSLRAPDSVHNFCGDCVGAKHLTT